MNTIDTPLPYYAEEFLIYMDSIKGKSQGTVKEYRYDLITFFEYFAKKKHVAEIADLDEDFIKSVDLSALYMWLGYLTREKNEKASTRARKISAIRSFFKYLYSKAKLIEKNPALDLETPKLRKKLPVYLELDQSLDLLGSIKGENETRDYCIITFFLNCGMRLSELCGINVSSIQGDRLTVLGKGDKERTIYLNGACMRALEEYLKVRPKLNEKDPSFDALFLSERKQRMSNKTVQYTVKKYIKKAGLDPEKFSTHKLRHTAATLLYKYGEVDLRSLQEILGHASVSTTQIYTHVDDRMLKEAVNKNPLADIENTKD